MEVFRLGDIVKLKDTDEIYRVTGVSDGGKTYYILPRSEFAPGPGVWVTWSEIEFYFLAYPGGNWLH